MYGVDYRIWTYGYIICTGYIIICAIYNAYNILCIQSRYKYLLKLFSHGYAAVNKIIS